MRMIFHAETDMSYACGQYRIVWNSRGDWDAWIIGERCLGRNLRIGEAIQLCQAHHDEQIRDSQPA